MANTSGETAAIEVEAREQVLTEPPRGDRTPESLADLFAPDVVLPVQFFEGARRDSQASGEKALMLAVLEDGIRTSATRAPTRGSSRSRPRRGSGPSTTSGPSPSTTCARRSASIPRRCAPRCSPGGRRGWSSARRTAGRRRRLRRSTGSICARSAPAPCASARAVRGARAGSPPALPRPRPRARPSAAASPRKAAGARGPAEVAAAATPPAHRVLLDLEGGGRIAL